MPTGDPVSQLCVNGDDVTEEGKRTSSVVVPSKQRVEHSPTFSGVLVLGRAVGEVPAAERR